MSKRRTAAASMLTIALIFGAVACGPTNDDPVGLDTGGDGSDTQPTKHSQHRSVWALLASIAYFLGAAVAFGTAVHLLDNDTTPGELKTWIAMYVVIGLVLGGLGQFMSASAHGPRSHAGTRYEGWGKTVAVLGWSFGLVGGTFFAIDGTNAPEWLLMLVILALFVPPAITLVWYFWPYLRKLF